MTEPPVPDERMLELAQQVLGLDKTRCDVLVDLFRSALIATKASPLEAMWAQVCLLVALVRANAYPENALDTVQRMIAIALEAAARKDIEDARIH